eukprot:Pgem_evm1s8494
MQMQPDGTYREVEVEVDCDPNDPTGYYPQQQGGPSPQPAGCAPNPGYGAPQGGYPQ